MRLSGWATSLAWFSAACCLSVCLGTGAVGGEEIPSIKELVKTDEKEEVKEEEKPKFPRPLEIDEVIAGPQRLLPSGPLGFVDVPNGGNLVSAMGATSMAAFLNDEKVATFFKNNPLTLQGLYSDLPPEYSAQSGINLLLAGKKLSQAFMDSPGRISLAVYQSPESGKLIGVYLADIGRERKQPFETMRKEVEALTAQYPEFAVSESDYSGDFIDTVSADGSSVQLAYGIVANYAVICTDSEFAKNILKMAKDGGTQSLSRAAVFADLGSYTDGKAQLRGFIDLRGIIAEAKNSSLPTASEVLDLVADLVGRGNPEAASGSPRVMYYDLSADGVKTVEHVISPIDVAAGESPCLPSRIATVCRTSEEIGSHGSDWVTPRMMPYQPDFFIAAQVKPEELPAFFNIADNKHFGGSIYAKELAGKIPDALRQVVTRKIGARIKEIASGEIGLSILPARDGKRPWIAALSIRNAAATELTLRGDKTATEINNVKIHSAGSDWQKSECWAVFDQSVFKHIKSVHKQVPSSCMVIASSGDILRDIIDQVTVVSSLADNKLFVSQIRELGNDNSLIWYYNLPGMVGRDYVNLSTYAKTYFPQIKSLGNIPPMSLINKHIAGIAGASSIKQGRRWYRSTIVAPMPMVPATAGLMTMKTPLWIRERARMYRSNSRENMGRIWLALQIYATQRGHFPESMTDLRDRFPKEDRNRIFTSEAAVGELGVDAPNASYRYLPGLRATDEPDLPVLYEAKPWHYEYSGMFPIGDDLPTESGHFERYRLVLTLEGTIRAYTEEEFKRKVLPRIRARD